MIYTLCFLENVPKHCLKRIETERSHHYDCRRELKRASLYLFVPRAVMCKFCRTQWRNNFYTETETRCAVQKPLLIEERTTYAFSMD